MTADGKSLPRALKLRESRDKRSIAIASRVCDILKLIPIQFKLGSMTARIARSRT
jgi:hypothetical protein